MGPSTELSAADIEQAIMDMKHDSEAWSMYSGRDFDVMERYIRRQFSRGAWEDPDDFNRGWRSTPDWTTYRYRASALNLIKWGRLGKMDESYKKLYEELFRGRDMSHVNQCVGKELDELMKAADEGQLPTAEQVRLRRVGREHPDNVWMKKCMSYWRNGRCQHGDQCAMWHLDQ